MEQAKRGKMACPAGCTHEEAHCPEGKRLLVAYQHLESFECCEVTPEEKKQYREYLRAYWAYMRHIGSWTPDERK